MAKGVYVMFEGIDGSGKSTLMSSVYASLGLDHGINAVGTREPGSNLLPSTKAIRTLLKDPSAHLHMTTKLHLFLADRNEHMHKVVAPALAAGRVVLQDRGYLSTLAYQVGGVGYDVDFIRTMNDITTRGVLPDIVVHMATDVDTALARIQNRARDDFEQKDFLQKVNEAYKRFLAELPRTTKIMRFDADMPTHEATDLIVNAVLAKHL